MEKRNVTDEQLAELRELVRPYLTEKRWQHTEAVAKEAVRLGSIYLPGEENRLAAAAWLHDITKKADSEKQLQYFREFGIILRKDEIMSPKIFHAHSAAAVAAREFPDYTDDGILSAIRWHTTGHDGMTVFEAIVYLADYIEETRTFDDCVTLRNYFNDRIAKGADKDETLRETMILSFDLTMAGLMKNGEPIDNDTVDARNYYISMR